MARYQWTDAATRRILERVRFDPQPVTFRRIADAIEAEGFTSPEHDVSRFLARLTMIDEGAAAAAFGIACADAAADARQAARDYLRGEEALRDLF